ncbi:MAG: peptide chain release factor 2, partial [Nitrospinales bacterium]
PEVDDGIEVEIKEEDLKVDVYRASGPGGQGVNTTDSAVRLTHIPSGIVVQCQNERSQHKNKSSATKVLKARLYEMEQNKQDEEKKEMEKQKKKIEWGSQIRSYVLHPYQLVKDLRTNVETGNVDAVLDGDLDVFIQAFLRFNNSESERSGK